MSANLPRPVSGPWSLEDVRGAVRYIACSEDDHIEWSPNRPGYGTEVTPGAAHVDPDGTTHDDYLAIHALHEWIAAHDAAVAARDELARGIEAVRAYCEETIFVLPGAGCTWAGEILALLSKEATGE